MKLDVLYLGSLFHDVGKFMERTKKYGEISKKDEYATLDTGWAHPKYSNWWVKTVFASEAIPLFKNLELSEKEVEEIGDLVLWHHKPKNLWHEVLQTSDHLSAGERAEEESEVSGKGEYYEEPLLSIFCKLFRDKKENSMIENLYYPMVKLEIGDSIFPKQKETIKVDYGALEESFESDLRNISSEADLLSLLEKYLWCVPSQVKEAEPDISLYDHLRVTSAIAVAYWHEIMAREKEGENYWRDRLRRVRSLLTKGEGEIGEEADFLLVGGDLSGIQSFIFDIPSKGAAKSLRGRSLFLSLLMEVVARHIVKALNLRLANILYIGGGLFWILAPRSANGKLLEIRRNVSKLILEALKGKLYIALAWVPIYYKFFRRGEKGTNFINAVLNLQRELSKVKMGRFKEVLQVEGGYELLFGSPGRLSSYEEHCLICGENERELLLDYDEPEATQKICKMCDSFRELALRAKGAEEISLKEIFVPMNDKVQDCFSLFKAFGFSVSFKGRKENKESQTFENLAQKSEGDDLLGYIKLDVDSLGKLFKEGFGEDYSISRVAALSRMLSMFFERYLPKNFISEDDYLVFAGGDDAFIISPWNRALELVKNIENSFREYVAKNPKITFSVGLFLAKPHYPVSRAGSVVEEELHRAKSKYGEEKNGISIFGQVFTKEEYKVLLKLWRRLKEFFSGAERAEARGAIFKVISFSQKFKDLDGNSAPLPKPWLFAYALRRVKDRDFRDYLVNIYERLPFKGQMEIEGNLINVRNPAILYVAACLAYLSTREVK